MLSSRFNSPNKDSPDAYLSILRSQYQRQLLEVGLEFGGTLRANVEHGANAEVIVGGSTGVWRATPDGSIRPPLSGDANSVTESLYVDRGVPDNEAFSGALTSPRTIRTTIVIPDYNPEWAFIDVRGFKPKITASI